MRGHLQFLVPGNAWVAVVPLLLLLCAIAPAHEDPAVRVFMLTRDLKRDPDNTQLRLARGRLLAELRRCDDARADFLRVLELDPNSEVVLADMGRMLLDCGRPEEALDWFNRYLALHPELGGAHLWQARTLSKLGRNPGAVTAYASAIERLEEPNPEVFSELAAIYAQDGAEGRAKAVQTLDAGVRKLGFLISLETKALELELDLGLTEAALSRLDRIIAKSPRKEGHLARKAEILAAAGRPGEAREADREALRLIEALPAARRSTPAIRELEETIRSRLSPPETTKAVP